MYRNIAQLIQKPLQFIFNKGTNIQMSDQKTKKQKKQKRQEDLSVLDNLLFRFQKPNPEFLQATYGFNAKLIRFMYQQQNNLSYSWTSMSTHQTQNENNSQHQDRIPDQILFLPFIILSGYALNREEPQCFFWNSSPLKKNQLEQRVVLLQYSANNPIEDRYKVSQLKNVNGYIASVFDGHGGWQVAELATNTLHQKLDEYLLLNKGKFEDEDEYIQASIAQAYAYVEQEFYKVALQAYQMGFPSVARVGSCALSAIVINNKVYSANLGDCKGVIVNVDKRGEEAYRKINHTLNANSKKEQLRLKSAFTDEDIVVCKRGKSSCYVKGRLQPTRAFGDFRLKFQEFNNPEGQPTDKGFPEKIKNFNGPYISAVPDQKILELGKGDRYLVLGCDGLWDELTKNDVAKTVQKHKDNKDQIIKDLFESALQHAAKNNNMTEEEIRRVPLGKRRSLHDDITIIVIDLDQQV